jgi:hypothetical protein
MISGRPAQGARRRIFCEKSKEMNVKSSEEQTNVGGCLRALFTVDSANQNNGLAKNFADGWIYQGEYEDDSKTNGNVYRL